MVPSPVKAVILLFPIDAEGEERRKCDDTRIAKEGQPMLDSTFFWMKQTVEFLLLLVLKACQYETSCGCWIRYQMDVAL